MAPYPDWANAWLQARDIDTPAIELLTLTDPTFGVKRLAKSRYDVVSRGDTFLSSYYETSLVNDDTAAPRATVGIPNVGSEIGQLIDRLESAPEATLEVISSAVPDVPVYRAARLEVRNIKPDPLFITGTLVGKDDSSEPIGTIRFVPSKFPAFFRRRS